jgi:cell wall-associated NlpC family hydrolase
MFNLTVFNFKSSRWRQRLWQPLTLLCALSACSGLAQSASNIPDVSLQQLNAQYWQAKPASDEDKRMKNSQIKAFNRHLYANSEHMVHPLETQSVLDKTTLNNKIASISTVPSSARFYADGTPVNQQHFQTYLDNTNTNAVENTNIVQFGLVVKRSALRTFPTLDRVFNEQMDLDLDRFQESAVFPAEAVAVLHQSADQRWYLVQNYNYLAWVEQDAIAIGSKQQIQEFIKHQDFLLITGSKVFTSYVPSEPRISQVQLDMGVKLPLLSEAQQQPELYGQSTATSYEVALPVRNDDGSLSIHTALIGRTQDVNIGYLDYTSHNLIAQAFKFLGERYGWGHDYNGRDCTGFVGEIYKTFGILMPRNSGQQGMGEYGTNFRFDDKSDISSKLAVIEQLQVGDLIYIPGHVMLYLGKENGQPFVIHDVKGLAYWTPDGNYYSGVLNAVSVTPLIKLQLNKKTTYLDKIYNIKRITLNSTLGK